MEAQPLRVGFLVTPDNVADFFAMMESAGWQHASSTRENDEVTMQSNGWQQVADRRSGDEFELTFAPPAPERDAEREMSLRDTLNSEARVRPSAPGALDWLFEFGLDI